LEHSALGVAYGSIFLISSILQFAVFLGAEITLTNQRILGRTGRFILRQVNIPIDNISWMDFPNKNLSKGPISIHTRDREKTTLWNLSRPEIFLEFLTGRYSPETMPVINKNPSKGSALGVLVVFILLGAGIYYIYTSQVKKPELLAPVIMIHLEADGSGDYSTLEKAIQHIAEGGTINLGAGTYRLSQPLEINKSISLIGVGMDQTIIAATTQYHVIDFSGEGPFVLQGLTVQLEGGGKANVVQVKNGEINFSDCRFKGDGNNGPGLLVLTNAKGTVIDCESINNGMHGFSIQDQSQLILESNKCTNNEESGMAFFNNSQGTVRKNECTGNKHGIYVADQAKVDLEENISSDNQEIGIFYSDNTSGAVRLNECTRNGNSGIWVTDQAKVTLEENTCSTNGESGIVFAGNTKSIARQNVSSNNINAGISVNEQAEPVLDENTCTNNQVGIIFHDFAKGAARRNQCSGNKHGIGIQEQSQPLLEGNITTENSDNGIYYSNKAGGIARQNNCSTNSIGIAVLDQSQPELEQNTCNDNKVSGIAYLGSAGGSAAQNECTRNQAGITVLQTAQPVLEGNVCTENEYGIFIESLASPDLRENDCHDNTKKNLVDER
jgi:parallel beta-helix repeat protein